MRVSNFVDHVRFATEPARAGTTLPRPKQALQASIAAISAPLRSRSNFPNSDHGLSSSGTILPASIQVRRRLPDLRITVLHLCADSAIGANRWALAVSQCVSTSISGADAFPARVPKASLAPIGEAICAACEGETARTIRKHVLPLA
ncbi:hypothetical protein [Methylobacterium oryzisoli]|uniref:hypothetical protein n=1 Tax=Methylobacterium oryzisoli TaxID=3385502 RepID=UPI0038927202